MYPTPRLPDRPHAFALKSDEAYTVKYPRTRAKPTYWFRATSWLESDSPVSVPYGLLRVVRVGSLVVGSASSVAPRALAGCYALDVDAVGERLGPALASASTRSATSARAFAVTFRSIAAVAFG